MKALEADRPLHRDAVGVLERDFGTVVILVDKPAPAPSQCRLRVGNVGYATATLDAAEVVTCHVKVQDLDGALVLVLVTDPDQAVYGLNAFCPAAGVVGYVNDLL